MVGVFLVKGMMKRNDVKRKQSLVRNDGNYASIYSVNDRLNTSLTLGADVSGINAENSSISIEMAAF